MAELGLYLALPFFALLVLNVPVALNLILSSAFYLEFSGTREIGACSANPLK